MAYGARQIGTVKYGEFGEYLKKYKKLEDVARSRGWAPSRMYAPVAGKANEIVVEWDYPDLAAFQKEMDTFQLFRSGAQHLVQDSVYNELLEEVAMDYPGSD